MRTGAQRQNWGGRAWGEILERLESFFICISLFLFLFFFFFGLSVCLSQATVDLFVCLCLSHTLETSHFHEVGMKRLEGRLAGGLQGREGTPGVSERRLEDVSVSERRGQLRREPQVGWDGCA